MAHFDLLAPFYDRLASKPEDPQIRELLPEDSYHRLLDAAGGTGRVAASLGSAAEQVILLDASLKMLEQAQEKDCCRQVGGVAERLPFRQGCFEVVILVDSYHHLKHQHESLRELWRVLAPGGRLIVEEPNIKHWGVKLVALAEKLALMKSHFIAPERLAGLLRALGGAVVIWKRGHTAWVVADKPRRSDDSPTASGGLR